MDDEAALRQLLGLNHKVHNRQPNGWPRHTQRKPVKAELDAAAGGQLADGIELFYALLAVMSRKGWTIADLARALHITPGTLHNIRTRAHAGMSPKIPTLMAMARVLGVVITFKIEEVRQ